MTEGKKTQAPGWHSSQQLCASIGQQDGGVWDADVRARSLSLAANVKNPHFTYHVFFCRDKKQANKQKQQQQKQPLL